MLGYPSFNSLVGWRTTNTKIRSPFQSAMAIEVEGSMLLVHALNAC